LICSVIGLLPLLVTVLFSLIGLALGLQALKRCGDNPLHRHNRRKALAACVLAALGPLVQAGAVCILDRAHARALVQAKIAYSVANLRATGQGLRAYANDHDGEFPQHLGIMTLSPYVSETTLQCAIARDYALWCPYHYVLGYMSDDDPDSIVAFVHTRTPKGDGGIILHLDGTTKHVLEPGFTEELERFKAAFEEDRGYPPTIQPPY